MSTETELLREAAKVLRERAQAADTGERWDAYPHYDALYVCDFKPSAPDRETIYEHRTLGLPDDDLNEFEQPADVACFAAQAMYMHLMDPTVALAVAAWLESATKVPTSGVTYNPSSQEIYEAEFRMESRRSALAVARAVLRKPDGGDDHDRAR